MTLVVGLTGGMGSGKSTVARMLVERGAHVIDADQVAREVVAPGEPALEELRRRFGDDVIGEDGTLDRAALAAVAFADEEQRQALNAITHPRIAERIVERVRSFSAPPGQPDLIVLDHPLLVETGQAAAMEAVVVVLAPVDVRVQRLAAGRGIDPDDARARIASQADDDQRRAVATHVIDNSGDLARLEAQVERVWADLVQRAAEPA